TCLWKRSALLCGVRDWIVTLAGCLTWGALSTFTLIKFSGTLSFRVIEENRPIMTFKKLLGIFHPIDKSAVEADLSRTPPMMNFNNQDRQPKPQRPCCRDKGRMWALCLSSSPH